MDTGNDFRKTGYPISDEMWRALITGEPLTDAEMLFNKEVILHAISIGIDVIRDDGRILGFDEDNNRFYDTKRYIGEEPSGLTSGVDKAVFQFVAGIFLFGLICMAGRYILWKNGMPTVTPGTMHMMPLPDKLEYVESEVGQMDSAKAVEIGNK